MIIGLTPLAQLAEQLEMQKDFHQPQVKEIVEGLLQEMDKCEKLLRKHV